MRWLQVEDGTDQRIGIDDPFDKKDLLQVERDARVFYAQADGLKSVLDIEMLVKGAKLGKDINAINQMSLTEVEEGILREEYKNSNLPGVMNVIQQMGEGMRVTVLATACAAVALGWQQSAINTSTQLWAEALGLHSTSWTVAAINAIPSLSGSIIGTWVSDPLQGLRLSKFYFGRRLAMLLSGVVSAACCIWSARCKTWQELLICRVILGIGFGTKASVAPIFAAEAAMEKSRGRILMLWQLFDALGIMLGFVVALIAPRSWEVQLGAALIPSFGLMLVVMLCPESPRLLIRNKHYGKAYQSLWRLRRLEIQAARDLYFIHVQLQQEVTMYQQSHEITSSIFPYQDYVEKHNSFERMRYLFTLRRNATACLVAFLVMAAQQLCGINVLSYYSSTVFGSTASRNKINLLNFGFGASNFVFTLPAFFLIDSKGRRFILLTSFFFMTFSLLGASFCFNIEAEASRVAAVVVTVIILYTASYSIGAGPVPFTLSAEIFPLAFREVGMSFSVMVNFLGLGLLVLFVPRITRSWPSGGNERIGQRNILFIFTGLNAMMLVLLFLLIPSTERKTLEDMNHIFKQQTTEHIAKNFQTARDNFKRTADKFKGTALVDELTNADDAPAATVQLQAIRRIQDPPHAEGGRAETSAT